MEEFLGNFKRTHMCGKLDSSLVNQSVTIMGFVSKYRNLGGLIFIDLRDITGISQLCFIEEQKSLLFHKASTIRNEFVIAVKGVVKKREPQNINKKMKTGEIEVIVEKLKILSKAETTPFNVGDVNVNENLRLMYRYLDLRRMDLQNFLLIRSKIVSIIHKFMEKNNFINIETPFLGKSTPEGARDYLVPSRVNINKFYALPQSPQLYKQLLMIAGMDRYYQIARCFRDEDLRANRQPEFTQVDIEMSFVDNISDVLNLTEKLIKTIFKQTLNLSFTSKFPKIKYHDAMRLYGTDKPDLRFDLHLRDLSSIVKDANFDAFRNNVKKGSSVRGICIPKAADFSRKDIDKLNEIAKTFNAKGVFTIAVKEDGIFSSITKHIGDDKIWEIASFFNAKNGDLIVLIADIDSTVLTSLGAIRVYLGEKMNLIDKKKYEILWVTHFPLYEFNEDEKRLVAMHHPFTSPIESDLKYIHKNPLKVRAKAYDLVINGQEAGGGSIRIHSKELQQTMFQLIGLTEEDINERFGFFVNAFNYGVPPHGGIALGLDRLVMLITKTDNIKDVIAFPKNQNAQCVMSSAPSLVEYEQLQELGINFSPKK